MGFRDRVSVSVRVTLGFRDRVRVRVKVRVSFRIVNFMYSVWPPVSLTVRVSVSVTVCIFQLFGVWGLALGISLA